MKDLQNDIPKYKKKKPQASSAAKRSNHKHEYVETISVFRHSVPQLNKSWTSNAWTMHCAVCGRWKGFLNGDFLSHSSDGLYKKNENGEDVGLTIYELTQRYPGVPIYTNMEDQYAFPQERVV